jgi:peptide/nickel transport system permease protein
MPALALALPLAAIIGQLLKQSLKEVMHLDYVTLARVKGYGETRVILREALRNASSHAHPCGRQFIVLIGGTSSSSGSSPMRASGNMAIDAVVNRDLPLIQGIVILFAVIFTAVNLVVDLLYAPEPPAPPCVTPAPPSAAAPGPPLALGRLLILVALCRPPRPLIAPKDRSPRTCSWGR